MLRVLSCLMFLVLSASTAVAAEAPAIAAAADLKFALTAIAESFQRETGNEVKLVFGSSGNFKQQIMEGAPFELFLSADENFVFDLAERGLTKDRGVLYGVGRLVLFSPHGSKLKSDFGLADLKAALKDGRLKRFALANPDHAPYGRAARAVLKHEGIWDKIESKLVLGENAAQAMQFAASGSSQGGLVPYSLSKADEVAKLGEFTLIPSDWHKEEPLLQRMALTKRAGPIATSFFEYLRKPASREIFLRFGFALPAEGKK